MRVVYEAIGAVVEAPGSTAVDASPADGQSFRVRSSSACALWALTGHRQSPGTVSITSPLLHDSVLSIQDSYEAEQRTRILNPGAPLRSQDEFRVSMTGSGTAGDFEQNVLLLRYEDVPGLGGEFLSLDGLRKQGQEHLTLRVNMALTAGTAWSGTTTIISTEDQLKANSRYALTGWSVIGADKAVVRVESPDWGNLGIASPHNYMGQRNISSTLIDLATTGIEAIPVFNSSNKSLVLLSALSAENVTCQVYVHMVRLK